MDNEELWKMCIRNNWFTSGSSSQYEKLFERNSADASYKELATIIWLCSENVAFDEIIKELIKGISQDEILKNTYKSLDDKEKDYIYRTKWAEYVKEDAENWAEINVYDEYPEDFMDGACAMVGHRYAFEGDYDCTLSYWDNIQNLMEEELSHREAKK